MYVVLYLYLLDKWIEIAEVGQTGRPSYSGRNGDNQECLAMLEDICLHRSDCKLWIQFQDL